MRAFAFPAAIVLLLAAATAVQVVRDRTFAHGRTESQILYFSSGDTMKRVALSYDSLLADVYWMRALQHFGRERQKPVHEREFGLLYPLLELATTLDPRFTVGYRFGAIFLSEPQPGGAGRPDLAIALLKRGIAFDPDKWDYYHDIGFIYYWNLHDYRQAAEWFGKGGEIAGAPWWLRTYAAVMLTRGGDRQASRAMWTHMGQQDDSEWVRATARLRLAQLDALDQIDALREIVRAYRERHGRLPASWDEIVRVGLLQAVPVDPSGSPYELDGGTGEVTVSRSSELWPLPTEPAAAPELAKAP